MTADVTGVRTVELRRGVLEKNDDLAAALRARFAEAAVGVSNWVSSPGSGKTALLEQMLARTAERGLAVAVLVGDCATDNDARRLQATGAPVRQIVTDGLCHLEADLLAAHVDELETSGTPLSDLDLLVIENVGNLVCPTAFDLGEDVRVALLSVTEGEDKPLKYPQTFAAADVVVITKTDIADAVEFDDRAAREALAMVAPGRPVLATSARTGEGVDALADLLLTFDSASSRARSEEVP
jgi:hydrogenase nickel incorporation protein HypB